MFKILRLFNFFGLNFKLLTEFNSFDIISKCSHNFKILTQFQNVDTISKFWHNFKMLNQFQKGLSIENFEWVKCMQNGLDRIFTHFQLYSRMWFVFKARKSQTKPQYLFVLGCEDDLTVTATQRCYPLTFFAERGLTQKRKRAMCVWYAPMNSQKITIKYSNSHTEIVL